MDKELNEIVKLDYNKNNLQLQLSNLEKELDNNPIYLKVKEIKNKLNDYENQIKDVAEKIIDASGKKSVENDNVKLTLVQQYKLNIFGDVPEKYMILSPDEDKIKKDLTLFKKKLDFAEMSPSKPWVRITFKKVKE